MKANRLIQREVVTKIVELAKKRLSVELDRALSHPFDEKAKAQFPCLEDREKVKRLLKESVVLDWGKSEDCRLKFDLQSLAEFGISVEFLNALEYGGAAMPALAPMRRATAWARNNLSRI